MYFLNDQWFRAFPQDQPNYILQNYMGRSSDGALPMHIDSFVPYYSDHLFMMQAGITLEEQAAVARIVELALMIHNNMTVTERKLAS